MRWEITQNERNDEPMVKTSKTMSELQSILEVRNIYAQLIDYNFTFTMD